MKKYTGNQKGFIYASCAAKDQVEVFEKYLEPLATDGISFCWGDSFDRREDRFIAKSNAVMLFLTKDNVREEKLRKTVEAAVKHDKPILSIYLEDVELDPGLSMQIESQQAMFVSRYKSDEAFIDELKTAAIFDRIEVTEQLKKKQKRRVFAAIAAALAAIIALVIVTGPMLTSATDKDALGLGLSKKELASIEVLCIIGKDVIDIDENEIIDENDEPDGNMLSAEYRRTENFEELDTSHVNYIYWRDGHYEQGETEVGDISDLTGIEQMKNLKVLILAGQQIEDITPLLELEKLKYLSLACNPVSSLDGLEKLSNLRGLDISYTNVSKLPEGLPPINAETYGSKM